jgi:predicted nucleotidyltransferase
MARGDAHAESDLDLLVDGGERTSVFDIVGFQQELEEGLCRRVDVTTPQSLHWFIRGKVLAEARPL